MWEGYFHWRLGDAHEAQSMSSSAEPEKGAEADKAAEAFAQSFVLGESEPMPEGSVPVCDHL